MIKEILNDAIYLNESGRPKSSLLLLLCLIDAIAKKHHPELSVGARYTRYLRDRFSEMGLNQSYRIEEKAKPRETDKLIHFSDIIYEYFLCFFVHEADDRTDRDYEVQIEYDNPGTFRFNGLTLMDRPNEKFIVKCDNLIGVLSEIIETDPILNS